MSTRLHRCDSGALPRDAAGRNTWALRDTPYVLALLLFGCGGTETTSRLAISPKDEGVEYRASWSYRSFEVDADLTLTTLEGSETCSSTGSLEINDVVSAEQSYRLPPTDCAVLRLTDGGDIVLHEQPTGHDWTAEDLRVDTERELVFLGPVTLTDPTSGEARPLRFTIAAPPCPGAPDCDCGALERTGGTERLSLDLGRRCD